MENKIKLTVEEDILVIKISGELDSLRVMTYKARILQEMERKRIMGILWDFKDLSFLDSSGIGLILGRYNEIRRLGGMTGLYGLNEYSRKIVSLTGLFHVMEEYKSVASFTKKVRINQ